MVEEKLDLPAPVLGFVRAMNMYDLDGMASRFAPDAIANDQMRHYEGREAIQAWLAKEIAGDRVTMFVTENLPIPVPIEELCRQLDIIEIQPLTTQGFEGGLLTDRERS